MKGKMWLLFCIITLKLSAQNDTVVNISDEIKNEKKISEEKPVPEVFYGQRLITAKTVEVLHKGVMAFTVVHTFGDIAGKKGGFKNFFGLDEVSDAQIGFEIGLGNRLNIALRHTDGGGDGIFHFYEAGLKYQFMKQGVNGKSFFPDRLMET